MPLPGAVEVGVVVAVLLVGDGRKLIFKLFAVTSGSLNSLLGVAPKLALVLPIIRGGCDEYKDEDATGLLLPIPDSVDVLLVPKSGRFSILSLSKGEELEGPAVSCCSTIIGCNISLAGLELASCGTGGGLKNSERGPSLEMDKQHRD